MGMVNSLQNFRASRLLRVRVFKTALATDDAALNTNADSKLTDRDEDLRKMSMRELLQKANEEDSDWLRNLLGDTLDVLLDDDNNNDNDKESNINSAGVDSDSSFETDVNMDSDDNYTNYYRSTSRHAEVPMNSLPADSGGAAEDDSKTLRDDNSNSLPSSINDDLLSLGYSIDEIITLRPKVVDLILQSQVYRPLGGIPSAWLMRDTSRGEKAASDATKVGRISAATKQKDVDYSSRDSTKRDPMSGSSDSIGTVFKWKAPSSERSTYSNPIDDPVRASDDRSMVGGGSKVFNRSPLVDELEDEEEISFWPSAEEFKDLLLEESRFRMEVTGGWVTPLLREENRWRFRLYESWLTFLDEGFGDTFDVLFDSNDEEEREYDDEGEAVEFNRRPRRRDAATSSPSISDEWLSSDSNGAKRRIRNNIDESNSSPAATVTTGKDRVVDSDRVSGIGAESRKTSANSKRASDYESYIEEIQRQNKAFYRSVRRQNSVSKKTLDMQSQDEDDSLIWFNDNAKRPDSSIPSTDNNPSSDRRKRSDLPTRSTRDKTSDKMQRPLGDSEDDDNKPIDELDAAAEEAWRISRERRYMGEYPLNASSTRKPDESNL